MILPLLAMLQTAASPPPSEEVVVIARRLRGWAGTIRTDLFGTRCKTTRSTGDREIDAIGCEAMAHCWPDTLPRLRAAHRRGIPAADARQMEAQARADFHSCDDPRRQMLIQAMLARRAAVSVGDAG